SSTSRTGSAPRPTRRRRSAVSTGARSTASTGRSGRSTTRPTAATAVASTCARATPDGPSRPRSRLLELVARDDREQPPRLDLEHGARRPARTPDRAESTQRRVDERRERPVVAERRYSSDGEAGRLAHGVRVRPLEPEPRRVDLAIARAEAHHELVPAQEHERLDDLTHVAADGSGGVRRSPRRVRELAHLHVEPALAQPLLHLESRRVDPIRVVAVDGVTVRESRP